MAHAPAARTVVGYDKQQFNTPCLPLRKESVLSSPPLRLRYGALLLLLSLSFSASAATLVDAPGPLYPAAVPLRPPAVAGQALTNDHVLTGLDVLEAEDFRRLIGRHVGIVCNQTSIDRRGRHIVDLMAASSNVHIVALFSPEHGIRGGADDAITDSVDARTGLKVYSLYNYRLPESLRYRPTPAMLQGIDTLVFDIQDIGSRYYTYISTLGYILEAAAPRGIHVIVLDRPNPIGGEDVEGPDLDLRFRTFAGYHNMPITHGMTVGELALLFNAERRIGASLEVVPMLHWRRDLFFDQTGLPWVNPSPNIRNPREAQLYAGIGLLEDLPVSVGRGTPTPFEVMGAPWMNGRKVAATLNGRRLAGVSFRAVNFVPRSSEYRGVRCSGIRLFVTDRRHLHPSEMGIFIVSALARFYPHRLTAAVLLKMTQMVGNETIPRAIAAGESPEAIIRSWAPDVARWRVRRVPYLLYR